MDPRFPASREDLYTLQMEVKQVQYTQSNHAERLLRLEKRQADDAALKSVWNSPFPGVLSGTPQTGPVSIPHNDMFDDLDEQGEQLLGSLHLGPAEEEPARRGAASRANSVRFDESALHGSSWGGPSNRHSGDFGPVRPGSGLMMERSLSHKSDGRHSSAGHSVHSHHSVASGRASSLGLDNNFAVGDDDDDSFEIPGPPPAFFILGTVPSIVRCWLTPNFGHATLLYADVCSGSQKSIVDYSLLRELDLQDEIQRDVDGIYRVRLNVYFAEAVVTNHGSRSSSPRGPVPSITVFFEVSGIPEQPLQSLDRKAIRIYLGSDALRAHSADILFSRNTMTLYGDERERLQVPFVRPEDDAVFRNICTTNVIPEKPKLNANAAPFVSGDIGQANQESIPDMEPVSQRDDESRSEMSPMASEAVPSKRSASHGSLSDAGTENDKTSRITNGEDAAAKDSMATSSSSETSRREQPSGIWGSWRHGPGNGADGTPRDGSLSGYQPAGRGRNMKVLKPQKPGSTSARTGASYEPPPSSRGSTDGRRKSQASIGENGASPVNRWDMKRVASISGEPRPQPQPQPLATREARNANTLPRSANPVGVASAFSWMTPTSKPKTAAGSE
ncbi:ubiquitin carboxyl-terminal hydrolase 19 [Fusarium albosuccineum]|uniref:Ubiquitin carboxyl-terminal hydrolase 19 n=1 Tax=Fusarium albosuccineum TaxID=1237068 RepID=A0A8H4P1C1_9HYPO|nr:ubiquitin carboxyl-terminal hydrolase 19 [Fusarium albosuccineum]